jgi:hypothetical protein
MELYRKKSAGFKSGDREGQTTETFIPIDLSSKIFSKIYLNLCRNFEICLHVSATFLLFLHEAYLLNNMFTRKFLKYGTVKPLSLTYGTVRLLPKNPHNILTEKIVKNGNVLPCADKPAHKTANSFCWEYHPG